ncbi:hypothetical protein DNTS_006737 [Danionella cerebrum]|uniref:Uncharacterized protein n=1 Tax=Danionella cerebrum TaxID=2873325 RepID=A0A553NLF7_9TELE|nr:hypothetical protein DNTS_006737 [Danionella translucida]
MQILQIIYFPLNRRCHYGAPDVTASAPFLATRSSPTAYARVRALALSAAHAHAHTHTHARTLTHSQHQHHHKPDPRALSERWKHAALLQLSCLCSAALRRWTAHAGVGLELRGLSLVLPNAFAGEIEPVRNPNETLNQTAMLIRQTLFMQMQDQSMGKPPCVKMGKLTRSFPLPGLFCYTSV